MLLPGGAPYCLLMLWQALLDGGGEVSCAGGPARRVTADTDFSSMGAGWVHPYTASNAQPTEVVAGYDAFRSALLRNFRYCHEQGKLLWLAKAADVRPR